jgi:hypothetical protein
MIGRSDRERNVTQGGVSHVDYFRRGRFRARVI